MNEGKRFSLQKKYLHILKQRIYFCNLIKIMNITFFNYVLTYKQ